MMSIDCPAFSSLPPGAAGPIRVLTLDLDDTLWPVGPTLVRAEQMLHDWLRAQAPATGGHIEHAPLLGRSHDQVLKEALGLDVGGEFLDEEVAVLSAHVGLRQAQLAKRDHLDVVHGGCSSKLD